MSCVPNLALFNEVTQEKLCTRCNQWKQLAGFVPDKRKRYGVTPTCRACRNVKYKELRKANPERYKTYTWNKEQYREHYKKVRDVRCAYRRARAGKLKTKSAAYQRKYRATPQGSWISKLRTKVNTHLRSYSGKRSSKFSELVGCSVSEFKMHLESQFQPGMNWQNRLRGSKGWQIDHILPCSQFDLTDPNQRTMCFHFTNMRPAWATDNMLKGKHLKAILNDERLTKNLLALASYKCVLLANPSAQA